MTGNSLPNKLRASSEGSNVWTVVGKVVAAVGGPILGSLALRTWFSKHPLLTAFLLVLYEAAVFCAGIVGELWKRLKDSWLDAIAVMIDYRVQELVSGYRSKYL